MNMGQMFLVLLATVLFSTMILSINSSMYSQSYLVINQKILLQAQKIADKFHQKFNAELLGNQYPFESLETNFANKDTLITINGLNFNVNIKTKYCDVSGNIASPTNDFQRVDIRISVIGARGDTLHMGTTSDPISKVYSRLGIY